MEFSERRVVEHVDCEALVPAHALGARLLDGVVAAAAASRLSRPATTGDAALAGGLSSHATLSPHGDDLRFSTCSADLKLPNYASSRTLPFSNPQVRTRHHFNFSNPQARMRTLPRSNYQARMNSVLIKLRTTSSLGAIVPISMENWGLIYSELDELQMKLLGQQDWSFLNSDVVADFMCRKS